jgi:hypothetical protein
MTRIANTRFMTHGLGRDTTYLDPELHRALGIKAAEADCLISDLISETVKFACRA